jgi:adenylate cyclase
MNEYFDTLAEPLKRHGADLTEFHADTIMCAWTAPQPETTVHHKAALAALEVVEAIDLFNERHAPLALYARIGLESGSIYVGHTGGGGHFTYSILGDCANTASRIEGLNKHIGTHLLATQSVVENLDDLLLRPLGRFYFVGKADPTQVVEIVSKAAGASEAQLRLCEQFAEALDVFRAEQWAKAAGLFEAILRDYPGDGPASFYLARCRRYLTESPPPEDPSAIRMEAK